MYCVTVGFSLDIILFTLSMLLPPGDPIKSYEEFLSSQPVTFSQYSPLIIRRMLRRRFKCVQIIRNKNLQPQRIGCAHGIHVTYKDRADTLKPASINKRLFVVPRYGAKISIRMRQAWANEARLAFQVTADDERLAASDEDAKLI